jgi:hypothetical protein
MQTIAAAFPLCNRIGIDDHVPVAIQVRSGSAQRDRLTRPQRDPDPQNQAPTDPRSARVRHPRGVPPVRSAGSRPTSRNKCQSVAHAVPNRGLRFQRRV